MRHSYNGGWRGGVRQHVFFQRQDRGADPPRPPRPDAKQSPGVQPQIDIRYQVEKVSSPRGLAWEAIPWAMPVRSSIIWRPATNVVAVDEPSL